MAFSEVRFGRVRLCKVMEDGKGGKFDKVMLGRGRLVRL